MSRKIDLTIASLFGLLTIGFVLLMIFNNSFFEFSWKRHHNPLSWYLRPLMLLPFCFFAYKKSFSGMFFSIFALATSMMWFPEPTIPSKQAQDFLRMEIEYLSMDWNPIKILLTTTIPLLFVLLGIAFWRRKVFWGLILIIFSAILKMIWSVMEGGESGYILFPAAIIGMIISGVLIFFGKKKDWI